MEERPEVKPKRGGARAGAGRPVANTVQIKFRCPQRLAQRLLTEARRLEITLSENIRRKLDGK